MIRKSVHNTAGDSFKSFVNSQEKRHFKVQKKKKKKKVFVTDQASNNNTTC